MVELKAFGKNWNGKFIIMVNDLRLVGVESFSITHGINWTEIGDVSEYMPIGWARGNESIAWAISLKNIRGVEDEAPIEGNLELAKLRMQRKQFSIQVVEENAVDGKSDWMFKSILIMGCVCGGNTNLVSVGGGGASLPSLDYGGNALIGRVTLADGSVYEIPAT